MFMYSVTDPIDLWITTDSLVERINTNDLRKWKFLFLSLNSDDNDPKIRKAWATRRPTRSSAMACKFRFGFNSLTPWFFGLPYVAPRIRFKIFKLMEIMIK
ncbi:hypothetical protein DERF_008452 [Dermatophagoides farinae]|uniref:Uncharacterized protein n=1 Tax=Dermatophagoides farinae TaxID=6954 RepID=A0A922I3F8_DERFA|nr:hypothetical protein DERF_008452 [Dermatophagoides farinae]